RGGDSENTRSWKRHPCYASNHAQSPKRVPERSQNRFREEESGPFAPVRAVSARLDSPIPPWFSIVFGPTAIRSPKYASTTSERWTPSTRKTELSVSCALPKKGKGIASRVLPFGLDWQPSFATHPPRNVPAARFVAQTDEITRP